MNCGTFEIQRITRAVRDVLETFEQQNCGDCGAPLIELHVFNDAYHCPACLAAVCVVCGCTENHACEGSCFWLGPGLCSTHGVQLDEALARCGVHLAEV